MHYTAESDSSDSDSAEFLKNSNILTNSKFDNNLFNLFVGGLLHVDGLNHEIIEFGNLVTHSL